MKQSDAIVLGLAAVAVYMIFKAQNKTTATTTTGSTAKVTEIFDAWGKAFANGWRYFSDGTTISPSGDYYQNGQMVWEAPRLTA